MRTSRRANATKGTKDCDAGGHVPFEDEEEQIEALRKPWRHLYQYACKVIKLVQSKTPLIGACPLARGAAHALAHNANMTHQCAEMCADDLGRSGWLHLLQSHCMSTSWCALQSITRRLPELAS